MDSLNKSVMKLNEILAAALLLVVVNSCSSYYYVVTDVNKDLSVDRTVYLETSDRSSETGFVSGDIWKESAVDIPFEVNFYDRTVTMGKICRASSDSVGALFFTSVEGQEDNPLLYPSETVSKRFRWFHTYYDYKAVFKGLDDVLPLAIDDYLTPQQRSLFFNGQNPPRGWNGVEMYYLLDDLNRKFVSWYSDAVFYVHCDMFKNYCSDRQRVILDKCKEDFMKGMDLDIVFVMEPDDFVARLAEIRPEAGFGDVYLANAAALAEEYEDAARLLSCFEYSFIHTVKLPGRYYDGNAADFIDGMPSWKVDAFRLLDGDFVLEAVSRKVNIWAFLLTFVLIALLLQPFAKVFARK